MGALITGFNATVSRAVSQEKRSSRFSLFQLMGPLGSLIGVSVGEPLYDSIGLWAVYLFSLGAYLWAAGVLVLRAGSREGRAGNGASGEAEQFTLATFRTILRRPNALVLGVWVLVLGAAMGTMMNFIPKAALDAGLTRIRPFFIAYPAAVIAVRLGSSRLLDHVHKRHAILAPLLILPVTLWLAPEVTTPFQLAVAGAAYGLCHGVLSPVLVATFLSQAPESFQGRMSLLFQMLFNLGTFAATNLGGWLAEASLGWAFRSVGLFALVGTGLLLVMWRRPMFAGDTHTGDNTHGKEHV
jgi:MFS family permease